MIIDELDEILSQAVTNEEWDKIWNMTKARYNMFQSSQGRRFRVGDSVQFDYPSGKHRGHYTGVITKMKTTSATIKTNTSYYTEWNMPYSYLKLTTRAT